MECVGFIIALGVAVVVFIASRSQPETRNLPSCEQPSGSSLNRLFALFLLDRWLDGGAHGVLGDADDPQDESYNGEDDCRDDSNGDDTYWDDRAGF